MGSSYDAQRNEFCAYVLPESETPYGLMLGNFKTYAQSTAKGGVRGLWDADTDQIIFGTHQIAYRVARRRRRSFRIRSSASSRFCPYAQISEFTLDRPPARHRSVLRSARPGVRSRRRLRRRRHALQSRRDGAATVAVFPWAMLVGQRFYGEPEHEVRAWSDGRFICSQQSRNRRRALVGRIARAGRRRALAARTGAARVDAPRDAGHGEPRRTSTT